MKFKTKLLVMILLLSIVGCSGTPVTVVLTDSRIVSSGCLDGAKVTDGYSVDTDSGEGQEIDKIDGCGFFVPTAVFIEMMQIIEQCKPMSFATR